LQDELIAALATPPIKSAVGIVRLSGENAIETAEKIFKPKGEKPLSEAKNRQMTMGAIILPDGRIIDSCMAVVFRCPNSYTGEDTVEFHCHGSPAVLYATLNMLYKNGARPARAGEFTKRAFLNGKMDLTAASAVMDLIDAQTADAAANAAAQVEGAILNEIKGSYDALLDVTSHFQALVDYPDDDIDELADKKILDTIKESQKRLYDLGNSFERGRVVKEGVSCAIIGKANAGKSSILNYFSGYDRSIVTSVEGTTRDTVEEVVAIGAIPLRLIDTAGFRVTDDEVEKIGIERSRKALNSAGIVLCVFDNSRPFDGEDEKILELSQNKKVIYVINKCDMPSKIGREIENAVCVSAKNGVGLDELAQRVKDLVGIGDIRFDGKQLTNENQASAVLRASEILEEAAVQYEAGLTPDAVLVAVEDAMAILGELMGKVANDDVLHRIFGRFCVGK